MTALAHRTQDYGAELEFRGQSFVIDPRGCLFWPAERMLIVSDLHLEKGSSFASRRKVFLPPYDTEATLLMLSKCIADWQPKRVLSLGDAFHDEDANNRLSKHDSQQLRLLMSGREWIWLAGNHDPEPPPNLGGDNCKSMEMGEINFTHEPYREFRPGEISGHLHPNAKIRQRGKSVRRRCLAGDKRRLIMPAFGAFTGGLNLFNEAFDGLFDQTTLRAWLLGNNTVYEIDGRRLVG